MVEVGQAQRSEGIRSQTVASGYRASRRYGDASPVTRFHG
jgi:hypothetical protein